MSKRSAQTHIRLRGVRQNNLKNFDLDLPLGQLIVVTGPSGSGKSSLAFDTLYAEGQRRYIETFSPYARQFFDRMDKPAVDRIDGIPPAIAIEQRNAVKTTRSTVGTMTEICDHMKVLWPQLAQLHCAGCGKLVRKDSPQQIWETLTTGKGRTPNTEWLVTFELPLSEKLGLAESLALIQKQGFQRALLNGEIIRLEDFAARTPDHASRITIIQDRVKLTPNNRARFIEACEQAYHFGKGRLSIHEQTPSNSSPAIQPPALFSSRLHCAACDLEYPSPTPALFSFNHPVGACPSCRGFGRTISIDYDLAIPDRSKSLADGAVKPWQTETGAECQHDMMKFIKKVGVPTDVPFDQLSPEHQRWVIDGDAGYDSNDPARSWPRMWYGVKGYFRWLESKSYKMHVRVLLSRYRSYTTCAACNGKRFNPDSLLYRTLSTKPRTQNKAELTLADFYALPVRDALEFIDRQKLDRLAAARDARSDANDPLSLVLAEVHARLAYLAEVGLGYLTLDRPTRTLSGGETERVNLTTCLGTGLVNTLFVLDEPSVGLHPRDTDRLVKILERLRSTGNTVVVVEHEASVMRAADQIIDLGPGHGESGGELVFQGTFRDVLTSKASLTGAYLSGRKRIELPPRRAVEATGPRLVVKNASRNNLQNLTVEIPLSRFVCLTGVSGSGKTTLAREVVLPLLEARLKSSLAPKSADATTSESDDAESVSTLSIPRSAIIEGWESLGRVVLVDQSSLGKTPRSNPAVYIGAFDDIREVFAQSELAKQRGLNASAFSFNSAQGQCERCRGAGFEKIEMQFLSDVFIRCPDCNGRRYREHILEVKVASPLPVVSSKAQRVPRTVDHGQLATDKAWSIGDILEATVDDAIVFLKSFADSRPAQRAVASLSLLQEVGLGYLRLGQPINTLSGGESQRLKLVSHLAEFAQAEKAEAKPTLFVFDEPTTGLHFDDVRVLLQVFQRLVDAGHSLLVIEHNLDVIKSADWLIDLGPDAGDEGGKLVAQGTPENVAHSEMSHTCRALRALGVS